MWFVDIDNSYCWYPQFEMSISTIGIKWQIRLPYWYGNFGSGEVQNLPFPNGNKTQNLKTHFIDGFGAVSRNAVPAVPSGQLVEHNIFAFALGLVPQLRLCLSFSLVWVTARLPL